MKRLAYFERFAGPEEMVRRERQLKCWTGRRKLELIHTQNPEMADHAQKTARDPSRSLLSAESNRFRMTRGANLTESVP